MNQHKAVVQQDPARGIMSLNVVRNDVVLGLELKFDLVGDCLDLRGRVCRTDDKILRKGGDFGNLEHADVACLLVVHAVGGNLYIFGNCFSHSLDSLS